MKISKCIHKFLIYLEVEKNKSQKTIEAPEHLKNQQWDHKSKYLYPHNYPKGFIKQKYTKGSKKS